MLLVNPLRHGYSRTVCSTYIGRGYHPDQTEQLVGFNSGKRYYLCSRTEETRRRRGPSATSTATTTAFQHVVRLRPIKRRAHKCVRKVRLSRRCCRSRTGTGPTTPCTSSSSGGSSRGRGRGSRERVLISSSEAHITHHAGRPGSQMQWARMRSTGSDTVADSVARANEVTEHQQR